MANPVAIYVPDPAAPRRGGVSSAQIIQIDPYRSGKRARGYADDARGAEQAQSARGEATIRRFARYADRFTIDADRDFTAEQDDSFLETGRRRAPAGIAFAAQQFAQEGLSPGLHFENYPPALAAYATAAQGGNPSAPRNGQLLELSV